MAKMHSGFVALRSECPLAIKRSIPTPISDNVKKDLNRIYEIWDLCKELSPQGGFLLGDYSTIDIFFTPVISRIVSSQLDQSHHVPYTKAIARSPHYQQWVEAALKE